MSAAQESSVKRFGTVGIVGAGSMGKAMFEMFQKYGLTPDKLLITDKFDPVRISEMQRNVRELIDASDTVVFSLPLETFYLHPNVVTGWDDNRFAEGKMIAHIASIQQAATTWIRHFSDRLVPMHPMVDLEKNSLPGKNVILCTDGLDLLEDDIEVWRDFWRHFEMNVRTSSPYEHDAKIAPPLQFFVHAASMNPDLIAANTGLPSLPQTELSDARSQIVNNLIHVTRDVIVNIGILNPQNTDILTRILQEIERRWGNIVSTSELTDSHTIVEIFPAIERLSMMLPEFAMHSLGTHWKDLEGLHTNTSKWRMDCMVPNFDMDFEAFVNHHLGKISDEHFEPALRVVYRSLKNIHNALLQRKYVESWSKVEQFRDKTKSSSPAIA